MLIRYKKPGGKEVDLPEGPARRLIAAGVAEQVLQGDEFTPPWPTEDGRAPAAGRLPTRTSKTSRRSR